MHYTKLLARIAAVASCAFLLSAQVTSKRYVDVTVTDPRGRLVTGLDREHFEVVENGVRRTISGFEDGGSPISIAVVSGEALPDLGTLGPEVELIQTPSLANALRQLEASKRPRRVLMYTSATALPTIPPGIQTVQVDRANLVKTLFSVHNQYRLEFESPTAEARIEVVLKQPQNLPRLQVNWK